MGLRRAILDLTSWRINGKIKGWGKAYAVFLLCAATSIVLPAQTFTTLVNFDGPDGAYPDAGLVQAANGDFYGTTAGGGPTTKARFTKPLRLES
jgi:hypothetical protein